MNLTSLLNQAWMWKCRGELKKLHYATHDVAQTQAEVLKGILARNHQTEFGIQNAFSSLTSPLEYQTQVPLSSYATLAPLINRIAAGEKNILTSEPVHLLEPTSGSTSGEKWIPYTRSLQREFQRAIGAWISDLMQHRPAVRRGRAYWSISPAFGKARRSSGGIPIGFEEDTAYLGMLERFAAQRILAVPSAVAKLNHIDNFRYCTLLHLLMADDLALISVWSPTYLSTLMHTLEAWGERLAFDLRKGRFSLPDQGAIEKLPPPFPRRFAKSNRLLRLPSILESSAPLPEKLQAIWPQLALISCWTDAAAANFVPEIRRLFPGVEIQPKGLLATEGCVSLPLVDREGAILAFRSHFFEFERVDENVDNASNDLEGDSQIIHLAHELSCGERYRVIITTSGGLYRYPLHDIIEVVGFEKECPLLKFMGKGDRASDMVGEKLSEPHVRNVLARAFALHHMAPQFSMVVPVGGHPPHYRLLLEANELSPSSETIPALAATIQAGLEENPYYRHAIQLAQLSPLDIVLLEGAKQSGWKRYEKGCLARGMKMGDIKPTTLDPRQGWPETMARFR